MRRYIPIAVALAVVVLLGAAIVASGEVLSFSVPGAGDSVVERVPAGQVEPQDFDGAGSQYYYFGPDFMCLIYSNSTVDCFGSNRYNVVSGAPTGTGFTNIDGGDTYACAFHQATRFTHCWGSINLRPRTTQPTATATPVPTATATTLPPGVTPEPTATATAGPASNSCELRTPAFFTLPLTLTGSWTDNCVLGVELENVAAGDRYYRWVAIVPSLANSSWIATLTSDQDTVLVLWEWNAITETLDLVEMNDDIVSGNTNSRIEWTPVVDKIYVFGLTTYNANTLGNFTFTLETGTASSQGQGSTGDQSTGHIIESALPSERRQ